MSSFHEVRLSLPLAIGATGGPERIVDGVQLASGEESRNARWQGSRRRWEIGGAVLRTDAAHELLSFFAARRGRLHGFRFRDPVDWKSCAPGETISAGDQAIRRSGDRARGWRDGGVPACEAVRERGRVERGLQLDWRVAESRAEAAAWAGASVYVSEAGRMWSLAHLKSSTAAGDLTLTWTRRARKG